MLGILCDVSALYGDRSSHGGPPATTVVMISAESTNSERSRAKAFSRRLSTANVPTPRVIEKQCLTYASSLIFDSVRIGHQSLDQLRVPTESCHVVPAWRWQCCSLVGDHHQMWKHIHACIYSGADRSDTDIAPSKWLGLWCMRSLRY